MIEIYYDEDTEFGGAAPIDLKIDTEFSLLGFTGILDFYGVKKTFTEEQVASKHLPLSFTADETRNFAIGKGYATLELIDSERRQTIFCKYLFDVKVKEYKPQKHKHGDEGDCPHKRG